MRFGVEFGIYPAHFNGQDALRQITDRAQVAYNSNFEALFVGHHYAAGPESAIFQPIPLLSYLAGQVPGMYLGTAVYLLPLHQPLMVAEYSSTLDYLCGGRFLFGIGQGYRDVEFNSFGIEKRQRRDRTVEAIEVIRRLWSEDNVTHHGQFYHLDGVTIAPKPLQQPSPPLLMGADTIETVARVPKIADHWIASRRHSKTFLREAVPAYKASMERNGKPFKGLFIFRDLCIGASAKEAENRLKSDYERQYEHYKRWQQPGEKYDLSFEELKRDRLIVGSPTEVAEQVMAYHEEFGAEIMWFMMDWPGIEPRYIVESIQRFGEEVIPQIKRALPNCPLP